MNSKQFLDLIGISPAPNNGTHGALHDIMHTPPSLSTVPTVNYKYCSVPTGRTSTPKTNCSCDVVKTLKAHLNTDFLIVHIH